MSSQQGRPAISSRTLDTIFTRVLPALVAKDPRRAVRMLATQLQNAVKAQVPQTLTDYSMVWRSTVSSTPEWVDKRDHTNLLTSHLRDALIRILKQQLLPVVELRAELSNFPLSIFRRIELDALAHCPESAASWAEEYVMNRHFLFSPEYAVEYWKLARAMYPNLSASNRQELVKQIMAIRHDEAAGSTERAYAGVRDRLWTIREFLNDESQSELNALISRYGEPRDLTAGNWPQAYSFGPSSAIDEKTIASAAVSELVRTLRDWRPTGIQSDIHAPSPEGAGRALKRRASAQPWDFLEVVDDLAGLEPTYLRNIIEGFSNALRAGISIDWYPALQLCNWIISQDTTAQFEPVGFLGRDVDWTWARRSVAHLLLDGLTLSEHRPSYLLRRSVWDIIEALSDDDEPPRHPEQHTRSEYGTTYANQTLSGVRSLALLCVTEYARWVYQEEFKETESRDHKSFHVMPEVQTVLDRHLDNAHDASPIIRAVYGQQFGLLLALDKSWAEHASKHIFDEDPYRSELTRAPWDAFLVYSQPSLPSFRLLKKQYAAAIAHIAEIKPAELPVDYDERKPYLQVADHVFLHALFDTSTSLVNDPLLGSLLASAPHAVASHLLWYGSQITLDKQDRRAAQQLRSYVEWRLSAAAESDSGELKKFGWWIVERHFPDDWLLATLHDVLKRTGGAIDPAYQVLESLATLTEAFPKLVLECVEAIVGDTRDPWATFGSRDAIHQILRSALEGHPELNILARSVASHMVRRGWLEFMEFTS